VRRTLSLLAVVSLGHVLLISAQVQTRRGLPAIQALTYNVFAGVQRVTDSVAGGVRSLWTRYVGLWGVAAENDTLRRRIAELEGQLQQEQAVAGAARALEQALALQHSLAQPTLAARVIAAIRRRARCSSPSTADPLTASFPTWRSSRPPASWAG